MKKTKKHKLVEFSTIPLFEVILSIITSSILVLTFSEYGIPFLSKENTDIQMWLIIFSMFLAAIFLGGVKYWRSKKIIIKINEFETFLCYDDCEEKIEKMSIYAFFFKKISARNLCINNRLFTISPRGENSFNISQEENNLFIKDVKLLESHSTLTKKIDSLNIVPVFFNYGFYLLMFITFIMTIIVFISVLTGNTHWFQYFR